MARSQVIVAAAIAISSGALPAGAQVSDARVHELMQQAAIQIAAGQTATQPGDARPVVRLALDDAVALALDRNLDIAVQRLNPQIQD
ncbi:MAG TPA: hypothetical protein VKH42_01820, partial [Vicinamibacterales bacterium]|nr:hypothetical protein [Vicinamibacterales bacterium]